MPGDGRDQPLVRRPGRQATASGAPAGIPAARPLMLSSRAAATGALTWSSAATAASTACGQPARWASRAWSRSACGAYSRS